MDRGVESTLRGKAELCGQLAVEAKLAGIGIEGIDAFLKEVVPVYWDFGKIWI